MPQRSLRIACVAESREKYQARGYSFEECCELTSEDTMLGVMRALRNLGHTVELIGDIKDLVERLAITDKNNERSPSKWDLVYNDSEGFIGTAREAQIPGLLEAYGIPFTCASAATYAVCLDKGLTKLTLELFGIPTAPFAIIQNDGIGTASEQALRAIKQSRHREKLLRSFPLFAKPAAEGTSKGVVTSSKIHGVEELGKSVEILFKKYPRQDIIIENFLSGREFTVGIIGTGAKARVLGVLEICWHNLHTVDTSTLEVVTNNDRGIRILPEDMVDFCTFNLKVGHGSHSLQSVPDPKDPEVIKACEIALQSWRLLKCRDLGRIDVRSDKFGPDAMPCIIEVNPLAGLIQGASALVTIAENAGLSYQDLIGAVVESAAERIRPTMTQQIHI
ncbi:hypothetical protein TWF569_006193 [Orbilia oligospora]|uniref:ATP-grasp domain-containing protein n=3 Tax=Orbilia oligospora TaxID=2813651 RepID=A0A7C8JRR5_ORBOL|nr:hypothetical protein TWF706_001814 [Orbilia oligospora]KAF3110601.1 hypothetical protein TWF102_008172 [Orbilia oligospora]KAF3114799.1 hypothetical protein TWF103_000529 [Orbilia oligospora]KAF3147104.1 hypothetical protein TWF569_006193 [Orbilia oligospora]KAF3149028.1 hypothetical protein TWF594_000476 [Orbilia oligospora]